MRSRASRVDAAATTRIVLKRCRRASAATRVASTPWIVLPGYVVDAAVYGLVRQAFKDKSAGDGGCERALEEACGAQKGGVFACAECAGANLQALSAAGCGNDAISAWCAGVPH